MRKIFQIVSLMSLLAVPTFAPASEKLGYDWIEGGYVILDIDNVGNNEGIIEDLHDGDGWAARGSFSFTENVFGFTGFSDTNSDATFRDNNTFLIKAHTDIEKFDVGIGFNTMMAGSESTQTDLVVRAAYTDIDFGGFGLGGSPGDDSFDDLNEDSSDGWYADAGVRSQLSTRFEGGVGLRYSNIESIDNLSLIGNALFEMTPAWSVDLEADIGDEVSTYMLGLRYSFGRY